MKIPALSALLLTTTPALFCQQEARLSVCLTSDENLIIVIGSAIHERYGFSYPMTYRIGIPPGSASLVAERRFSSVESWGQLPEKTAAEHFNAVEATRFDYSNNLAFVSAAFDSTSDSLFIRLRASGGTTVSPEYRGIARYYDERRAAVTITGDDCADWTDAWFPPILSSFRSYGLYATAAVNAGPTVCSPPTWLDFQKQLDSGCVELASHSRTHPFIPYADYPGEVEGSADDIVNNVQLPALFRRGAHEYVYVWVAPYGNYDAIVDSLIGVRGYLVPRLYNLGDTSFSTWDDRTNHFSPINLTVEIGAPSWGGGETDSSVLNGTFDAIASRGGVYHLMWHAQVVYDDLEKPYFKSHLGHISGRNDIWYVNLGHLYLYHLLQAANSSGSMSVFVADHRPVGTRLMQNYPNPFNPATAISYQLSAVSFVTLKVYDILGRETTTLVNEVKHPGIYSVRFDASGLASGVYFYTLTAEPTTGTRGSGTERGGFVQSRRMVLVK